MAGINRVPPALRGQFAEIVQGYSSGDLTDDEVFEALLQLGIREEVVEEMLIEWQSSYEEDDELYSSAKSHRLDFHKPPL